MNPFRLPEVLNATGFRFRLPVIRICVDRTLEILANPSVLSFRGHMQSPIHLDDGPFESDGITRTNVEQQKQKLNGSSHVRFNYAKLESLA
jgi:hypothetical protein